MKHTPSTILFDSIVEGMNCRYHLDAEALVPDILENGLETPLMVTGDNHLHRGYRRRKALSIIRADYPAQWAKMFPENMIPVIVVTEATDAEIASLHIDHGSTKGLNRAEAFLAAFMLFIQGFSESRVANKLQTLFDALWPIKGDKLKEFKELLVQSEAAYAAEYAKYRRGLTQAMKAFASCPIHVMAQLQWHETSTLMPGFKESQMPAKALTHSQIKELEKAHDKDLKDTDASGMPRYSREKPGPVFLASWNALLVKVADKVADTSTRSKAWSGEQLNAQVGKLQSEGLRRLTLQHSGKDQVGINDVDADLYRLEVMRTAHPTWYAEFVALADETIATMREEAAQAEASRQQWSDFKAKKLTELLEAGTESAIAETKAEEASAAAQLEAAIFAGTEQIGIEAYNAAITGGKTEKIANAAANKAIKPLTAEITAAFASVTAEPVTA